MTSYDLPADAELDTAAIADAVTRLGILRRLADLGMRLAEEVVERAVNSPYHPEVKHEPCRAFAAISRAVRLTLALQVRMEDQLIALRKGKTPAAEPSPRAAGAVVAAPEDAAADPPEPLNGPREALRESESERFDELVTGPFEDCVAAIRADLGLAADDDVSSAEQGVEAVVRNIIETASTAPAKPFRPVVPATATALVLTPCPPDSG